MNIHIIVAEYHIGQDSEGHGLFDGQGVYVLGAFEDESAALEAAQSIRDDKNHGTFPEGDPDWSDRGWFISVEPSVLVRKLHAPDCDMDEDCICNGPAKEDLKDGR